MGDERRIGPDDWAEAVADIGGPQLVVAGPGTGKTEFLVRRAIHLLDARGMPADGLLILTFSRRGAADLHARIVRGLDRSSVPLAVSTFHSFAVRVLEAHGGRQGRESGVPTLLTGPEQVALVAGLLAESEDLPWPITQRAMLSSRTFAADVADFLLRMAERRIGADRLTELAGERSDWRALPAFHDRYRRALAERHRIDYGTLLDRAVDLLEDPAVGRVVADQFDHVLVDEYQDTSPAQADLLDAVTVSHRMITAAADPYQSIYGFRGADVGNVVRFTDRFHDLRGRPARRLVLDTSFRVPAEILEAAERISAGGELPGGAGRIRPAGHGGRVDVHTFDQASAEAEWIASELERMHLSERIPYRSLAVLVRSTRNLLPELSRALDRRGIPHDRPDTRLVDHPAVRLVFDLTLAAVAGEVGGALRPQLADGPVRRLLLSPLVGIGVAEERSLQRDRLRREARWVDVLAERPDTADMARVLATPRWATEWSAVDGFWHLMDEVPRFTELILADGGSDHRAALTAFAQALEQQEDRDPDVSLFDYHRMADDDDFEATPLLTHRPSEEDRLTLTTLHQAKGLEFDAVFIADATEDVFPDLRRGLNPLDPSALGGTTDRAAWLLERLREETRLAYTSLTRARRRVVMTATTAGIDEGERRPSRFLLAAADVESVDLLRPPPVDPADPLTSSGLQTMLRRTLMDPAAPLADRLAAATALVSGPPEWEPEGFAGVRERGPDRGVMPDRFRLSPSQAESYGSCPRRYVFERRLAMTDTSSPHARFGTLVHAALERADGTALEAGRPRADLADAMESLDVAWDEGADFGSPHLDAIWRARADRIVTRLFDEWPADSDVTVAAEHVLECDIGGIRWIGRADRIERVRDGSLRVIDYKTSASIASKKEAAESLQLAFYAVAAAADAALDGPVGSAELWYPATTQKGFRRPLDMTRLDDLRQTMVEIGQSIGDEDWTPTPGDGCGRCAVRIVCPEWPEGREAFAS